LLDAVSIPWPRFLWDKTSRDYFDPDTVHVAAYQLPAKLAFISHRAGPEHHGVTRLNPLV